MISLNLNEQAEKLRKEFSSWLVSNPAPQIPAHAELDEFVEVSRAWQIKLASERFIGVHWPEQYGGRGLSIVEEALVQELLAGAHSPQLIGLFGLTMVGPVLIKHGSDQQKEKFLKKILMAEEIWCQGFSEPNAGSDLASLKTSAKEKKAGGKTHWELSGQKIWTSFAQYSDWCFMLARSDSSVPKHKGLSYFLVPMSAKGIEVRPLVQISGDAEFNEIFFDQVEVAAENMVGQPGDGWKIALSTLMYERVVLTFIRHLQSEQALDDIRELLTSSSASKEQIKKFGRLHAKSMAVRALALSHLVNYDEEHPPGPEGSMDKLGWSEAFQEICKFGLELQGETGILTSGDAAAIKDGLFQHLYLYSRGRTIAAGTSEIQRSIIAERVLGLPRK